MTSNIMRSKHYVSRQINHRYHSTITATNRYHHPELDFKRELPDLYATYKLLRLDPPDCGLRVMDRDGAIVVSRQRPEPRYREKLALFRTQPFVTTRGSA